MANHKLSGGRSENIYVVGFDHLWTSLGARPVHGVKIDVQGMELQVLEGMSEALVNQRPTLVIEFHSGVDRQLVLDALKTAGYRLPGTPIETQPDDADRVYRDDRSYVFGPMQGSRRFRQGDSSLLSSR
jgi:hypothetical protein